MSPLEPESALSKLCLRIWVFVTLALGSSVLGPAPTPLLAQESEAPVPRLRLTPVIGYAIVGDYFRGPGGVALRTENGLLLGLDLGLHLAGPLSLAASVAHARTDWTVGPLPFVGTLDLEGARLWFFDLALRGEWPAGPVSLFIQGGAGLARYSIDNALISGARENLAVSAGAGVRVPVSPRLELAALVKDYVVSFRSVDELAALGVSGRRSHTVGILAGLTFSW